MKVILFSQDDGQVAVLAPTGELSIEDTAKKDVPVGKPFIIVDHTELPDAPQETWVVDFSEPDGFGGQHV